MGENPGATRTPRVARSLDRRAGERAPDREPFPSPPRRRSTTATPSPRARAFQTGRGRRATWRFPLLSTGPRVTKTRDLSDVRRPTGDSLRETAAEKLDKKTDRTSFHARRATLVSPRARAGRARGRGRAFAPRSPDPDRPSRHTRLFLFSARNAASAVPAPMAASAPASLAMVFGCSPNVLR